MIKSFRHKGLREYYETGNKGGINPDHASMLARMLDRLDASVQPSDMNLPGYYLHQLSGQSKGMCSVRVSGNWRITFTFVGEDATDVDYLDYHQISEGTTMIARKPTHPGEVLLEDVIKPLGLTVTDAARNLGVSRKTLSELVNRKSALSPEMALRIAKATKTSPESWLNMQTKLNLWNALQHEPENVSEFSHQLVG